MCTPASRGSRPGSTGTGPLSGVRKGWWRVDSLRPGPGSVRGRPVSFLVSALGLCPSSRHASQEGWVPVGLGRETGPMRVAQSQGSRVLDPGQGSGGRERPVQGPSWEGNL